MAYYPKNKILTNQSISPKPLSDENGNSYYYILPNGEKYEGFCYILANGATFTGKFPGDGKNILLTKYISPEDQQDQYQPTNTPFNSLTPVPIPPLHPTPNDYKLKNNINILMTIMYKPFFIKWMLTGDIQTVTDFNYYSIRKAEENEKVHGLNEFLKMNYTQYYK